MYALYKLNADELDERFLDMLKSQLQGREIEISVCEAGERAEDETEYLLRSPANRERLLRAIENVFQSHDRFTTSKERQNLLDLRGTIEFAPDYDHKVLRHY